MTEEIKEKKTKKQNKNKSDAGVAVKLINYITTVIVVLLVALAIFLVGFRIIGFDTYVVLSGSMEPVHKTGALIYARDADTSTLETGDVITFQSPGSSTIVTHRIIDITDDGTGRYFQTKGDANAEPDAQLVPESNVIGKVAFSVPYLGYLANYIQNPPGLYFAAAAGVILVLLMFISDMLMEDDEKTMKKKSKNKKKKKGESKNEEK